MHFKGGNKMYKDDLGYRIKVLRKYICGYSRRKLAKLVNEDIETIRMLEEGKIKNPSPQLILKIAEALDSFYMNFVKREHEKEFLYYLDWGTNDDETIIALRDLVLLLRDIAVQNYINRTKNR